MPDHSAAPAGSQPWWKSGWFAVLMVILFAPVGIILTWMKADWGVGRKIALTLLGLIIIGVGLSNPPQSGEAPQTAGTSSSVAAPQDAAEPPAAEPAGPKPGVTMANYGRLQTGMSYREAVAILGAEGEELSSNELGGTRTVMYQWKGRLGANMNAMFQNDRLIQKAQSGLR